MSGDVMQESKIEIKQSILKEHCFTFKNTSIALIEIPLYQDVKKGRKAWEKIFIDCKSSEGTHSKIKG
jgi:hypothetical protein